MLSALDLFSAVPCERGLDCKSKFLGTGERPIYTAFKCLSSPDFVLAMLREDTGLHIKKIVK